MIKKVFEYIPVTSTHSYYEMCKSMQKLADKCPDLVKIDSTRSSANGLDITVLILENESSQHHILVQGGIHGREHMTSWLTMSLCEKVLRSDEEFLFDTCFHLIPMSNPDGVTTLQTRKLSSSQKEIYSNEENTFLHRTGTQILLEVI